jgi:integrase
VGLPKGVHRVTARGREYFYFQANRGTATEGPRFTLPKDPHSPEFWFELRKAQGLTNLPEIPTFGGVGDLYQSSPHFIRLGSETKRQYRRLLTIARKAWGNLPAEGVRPKHVRALLDELADVPGTANNVLGLLRALSQWGLERGHFQQSLTEGVKPYKSDGGHKPWSAAQCVAAEKHLTGMVRRAYFLARYTGQRGSDVVRLGNAFVDDGGFRMTQKKTKREVWCPIDDVLGAEMATWNQPPSAVAQGPRPYLVQKHGKVYSRRLLDKQFADARAEIPELAGTTLHGLRGTRVVELRQRGATTMQIQDQVGMSLGMIERYCRFADKKANGKAAVLSFAERLKNSKL